MYSVHTSSYNNPLNTSGTDQISARQIEKPRKTKLSRDAIVEIATKIADEQGLESLSMRKVARHFDCVVMALYNHVENKTDLISAVVDRVGSEIELVEPTEDWSSDLRRMSVGAYKLMLKHPWLPAAWRATDLPAKRRYEEHLLKIMREAGLSEELSCLGFHGLNMHLIGYSLQAVDLLYMADKKQARELGKAALKDLSEAQYPYLREHVNFHLKGKDVQSDYLYILNAILKNLSDDAAKPG